MSAAALRFVASVVGAPPPPPEEAAAAGVHLGSSCRAVVERAGRPELLGGTQEAQVQVSAPSPWALGGGRGGSVGPHACTTPNPPSLRARQVQEWLLWANTELSPLHDDKLMHVSWCVGGARARARPCKRMCARSCSDALRARRLVRHQHACCSTWQHAHGGWALDHACTLACVHGGLHACLPRPHTPTPHPNLPCTMEGQQLPQHAHLSRGQRAVGGRPGHLRRHAARYRECRSAPAGPPPML